MIVPLNTLKRFIRLEAIAGILLFFAAALSMAVANSPIAHVVADALNARAAVIIGPLAVDKSVLLWINDGFMAVFFLLVGLELKREVLEGQLSSVKQIAMPVVAATGGFVVPALLFYLVNKSDSVALQGWAIPTATDIAFALGVLLLFGKRIPMQVKVFLASLAIIDDLAAIIVIALFYTGELSLTALSAAGLGIAVLAFMNIIGVVRTAAYIVVGVLIWVAVLKSGIHATLAGVIVAMAIPLRPRGVKKPQTPDQRIDRSVSPLRSLEHSLHPWVSYAILPIFAFANAGVSLQGLTLDMLTNSITLGIALGLFFGKQLGVFLPVWLGIRLKWFELPEGANMLMLYGTALATGIGFTMSFFIGSLAYENLDAALADSMKLGVLTGSMMSLVAAIVVLLISTRGVVNQDEQSSGG